MKYELRQVLEQQGYKLSKNEDEFHHHLSLGLISVHPNITDVAYVAKLIDFNYSLRIYKCENESLFLMWEKTTRWLHDLENEFKNAHEKIINEQDEALKYGYERTSIGSYERRLSSDTKILLDRMTWSCDGEKTDFLMRAILGNYGIIRVHFKESDGLSNIIASFEQFLHSKHPEFMFSMNDHLRDGLVLNGKEATPYGLGEYRW